MFTTVCQQPPATFVKTLYLATNLYHLMGIEIAGWDTSGAMTSPWQSHHHLWRPWTSGSSAPFGTNNAYAHTHKGVLLRNTYTIIRFILICMCICNKHVCLLFPVGKLSAAVNVVVSPHPPINIKAMTKWSAPSSMSRSTTWCILKSWDHGCWPKKCMPGRNRMKCMISRCDLESCLVCLGRGMETIKPNP